MRKFRKSQAFAIGRHFKGITWTDFYRSRFSNEQSPKNLTAASRNTDSPRKAECRFPKAPSLFQPRTSKACRASLVAACSLSLIISTSSASSIPGKSSLEKQKGRGPATQFPAHMSYHLPKLIFINKTFSALRARASHFVDLKTANSSTNLSTSSLRVASAKGRRVVAARRDPCFFFMKARVDGAPFLIQTLVKSLPFVSTAGRGAVPSGAAPALFRGSFPALFRKRKSRP